MPFTKIQPQQLQLPTFLSPSGDFTFQNNSTGFNIDLNRELSGDFNFTDSVTVNDGQKVVTAGATNNYSENSLVLGGTNNTLTGDYNLILNGVSNTAGSGNYNVIINSEGVQLGQSGKYNTAIGGDSLQFGNQTTGSVIIADHDVGVTNNTNNSLVVSFANGVDFKNGDIYHNGDRVHLKSHLSIDNQHSGIFSGNALVGGTLQVDGKLNADDSAEIEGSLYVNSRVGQSVFSGDVRFNNIYVQSSAEITGSLLVSGSSIFDDSVTLEDGTLAASRGYVGTRFTNQISNTLTGAGTNFFTDASAGQNILDTTTPVSKAFIDDHIITGHILSGYAVGTTNQKGYLVLKAAGFTGAIQFDKMQDDDGIYI